MTAKLIINRPSSNSTSNCQKEQLTDVGTPWHPLAVLNLATYQGFVIFLPTCLSHLLFWPQYESSRGGCGLPSSPNTAPLSPASADLFHKHLVSPTYLVPTTCILLDLCRTLTRITGNVLDLTPAAQVRTEAAGVEERQEKVRQAGGECARKAL